MSQMTSFQAALTAAKTGVTGAYNAVASRMPTVNTMQAGANTVRVAMGYIPGGVQAQRVVSAIQFAATNLLASLNAFSGGKQALSIKGDVQALRNPNGANQSRTTSSLSVLSHGANAFFYVMDAAETVAGSRLTNISSRFTTAFAAAKIVGGLSSLAQLRDVRDLAAGRKALLADFVEAHKKAVDAKVTTFTQQMGGDSAVKSTVQTRADALGALQTELGLLKNKLSVETAKITKDSDGQIDSSKDRSVVDRLTDLERKYDTLIGEMGVYEKAYFSNKGTVDGLATKFREIEEAKDLANGFSATERKQLNNFTMNSFIRAAQSLTSFFTNVMAGARHFAPQNARLNTAYNVAMVASGVATAIGVATNAIPKDSFLSSSNPVISALGTAVGTAAQAVVGTVSKPSVAWVLSTPAAQTGAKTQPGVPAQVKKA